MSQHPDQDNAPRQNEDRDDASSQRHRDSHEKNGGRNSNPNGGDDMKQGGGDSHKDDGSSHKDDAKGAHANGEDDHKSPISVGRALLVLAVLLIIAVVIGVTGVLSRLHARTVLAKDTDAMAAPSVLVDKPVKGNAQEAIQLPGALQAYVTSPIYARTSGYLRKWYFDIGGRVHKGQLLAVIESPEVDQQLEQAQADLATAQANAKNAAVQSARYQDLVKSDAVSQQDTDTFVTQQASTNTQVQSAVANVKRLQELVGFERVISPIDGIVTARNVDTGQLINAGATSPLFQVAQINILRTYVAVPQIDSLAARPGLSAQLTLAEYPGINFQGKIVRTANAIDPNARTLLVEVDVNNHDHRLLPGAYAEVHMKLPTRAGSVIIPVPTLIFRAQGLQVATVTPDNKIVLKAIQVGQDDGKVIEVTGGLNADDEIVQNPPDSIVDGETVHVRQPQQQGSSTSENKPGGKGGNS